MAKSKFKLVDGERAPSAYSVIRRRIVSLEYRPGMSLDEKSLVDELGLSRTPVREALIRLAGEGLIEIEKNKGAKVTELDLKTLQSIFEAGDLIERAFTRLACLRRSEDDLEAIKQAMLAFESDLGDGDITNMVISNTEFHLRIAAAAGNKYFLDSYRRILADHERIAQMWYQDTVERGNTQSQEMVLAQHQELFAALKDRDADRAEKISMEHASLCKEGIRALLSSGEEITASIQVNADAF